MRKQDRIAQEQQQNRQPDASKKPAQPQPREAERMKSHADEDRPMRQPGEKLPLPD